MLECCDWEMGQVGKQRKGRLRKRQVTGVLPFEGAGEGYGRPMALSFVHSDCGRGRKGRRTSVRLSAYLDGTCRQSILNLYALSWG